jgi:hypothetical protein
MRNLLPLVVVLVAAILLRNSPASAKVTDDQIQAAIDQGVEGLLASQNEKGLWSAAGGIEAFNHHYQGGNEVCAMLALAYAGVTLNEPKMKKGLDALLELKLNMTYTCSLRILVLSKLLHNKIDRERRERVKQAHVPGPVEQSPARHRQPGCLCRQAERAAHPVAGYPPGRAGRGDARCPDPLHYRRIAPEVRSRGKK